LEWEVQPTEQPIFDFSSEPVQVTTPSSTVQPSAEQEVIRHQLDDEADESPRSYRIQSTVLPEEIARRNEERVSKIQEITSRIQNAESIAEYESQPAYLRRNVEVKDERPSQDNNVSRFGLSGSGNGDTGLRSNSYLHDNVD
jgi:cell division protein FtsZ